MDDFKFEPLIDSNLGLSVSAETMEIYTRYIGNRVEKDEHNVAVLNDEQIYNAISLRMKQLNQAYMNKVFAKGSQVIPSSAKDKLRRNILDGGVALSVLDSLGKQNVPLSDYFVSNESIDSSFTPEKNTDRISRASTELNAIRTNYFGSSEKFPKQYARILREYVTEKAFNELQNNFYAQSLESSDVLDAQAKRAVEVLETLEKHYKGMYRVKVHPTYPSQIQAELLDVNNTSVVLLPKRDGANNDVEDQLRNVGNVLTSDNIYTISRSLTNDADYAKYHRTKDSQDLKDVPGDIVLRTVLLNTVDAKGKPRLQPRSYDAVQVRALNTPANVEPTQEQLERRSRTKGRIRARDLTSNEQIRRGIAIGRNATILEVKYFAPNEGNKVQSITIAGMPQPPVNSIAALGGDNGLALAAAKRQAAKESDIAANAALIANNAELQDTDIDALFMDDLPEDDVSFEEFLANGEATLAANAVDLSFGGVSKNDELAEIEARMDFGPDVRKRVIDLNRETYGPRDTGLTPAQRKQQLNSMDEYLIDDIRRMGVNPSKIEMNEAGTYRIHIPKVNRGISDPEQENIVHVPLGNLMNYRRDLKAYVLKANNSTKGVFVPGYRTTVNRDTSALQVVGFTDIIRQNIHKLMFDQVVNPAYANDTLDPYTRLDKIFTVDGYGTLFQDIDPNVLNEDQLVTFDQASKKLRFMTEIANSANMFNEIKDGSTVDVNNERIKFANNESLRTPGVKYWNVIDPTKASPDGITLYMGVDTKIAENGDLYSDDVPSITDLTNSQLKATNSDIFDTPLLDLPFARSPRTIQMPTSVNDSPVRMFATSHQLSRIAAKDSKVKANVAYMTSGGHGIGDGFIISKAFADRIGVQIHGGEVRGLIEGDKLSDGHGDKGLAVTIIDPESTDPKLAQLNEIFKQNPDLEVIGPFSALISRGTGGAALEANQGYIGHLNDVEVNGETIKLSNISYSNMDMVISDMNADKKNIVYTEDAYRETGKGRIASSQFNATLTSLGAIETLKHIYSSGEYKGQAQSHTRLIASMNVLGYDIDKDGNVGLIDNESLVNDPSTVVIEPRAGHSFKDVINTAANQKDARRVAIRLPEEVKLASGQTTKVKSPDGTVQNILFMPISYLNELDKFGMENKELITKDAYRNSLKAVYDISASYKSGYDSKTSLTEAMTRLSNIVENREFINKDTNVVKRGIYNVALKNSATSVLTADPTLPLDTIAISREVYENMGKPDLNKRVLIWRDPMLRPTNQAAYHFVIDDDIKGVGLNPVLADKMDGDFDGDTLGVFFTDDEKVQQEWDTKLAAENAVQYLRHTIDGTVENMMDINGDVELPYRKVQIDIRSKSADKFLEVENQMLLVNELMKAAEVNGDQKLIDRVDELTYSISDEYLTDTYDDDEVIDTDAVNKMIKDEFILRMPYLMKDENTLAVLKERELLTEEDLVAFNRAEDTIETMRTGAASVDELETMVLDKGLLTNAAYGTYGLDAENRETVERSISEAVDGGYKGKPGSTAAFMNKFDGKQTVGEYFKDTEGQGYKSDFVGLAGTLQQVLIARTRGFDDTPYGEDVKHDVLDKAMNLDPAQRSMRSALQATWIATDGVLQAKHTPENGKMIQQMASVDLNNLVKGLPRDYNKPHAHLDWNEHLDRMTREEWVEQMMDVLTNPNEETPEWREAHPGKLFEPGLNSGAKIDPRDIEVLADALSDENGNIRTIQDDLRDKKISGMDAIAYGPALFGQSHSGLSFASQYGLSMQGNKYQNVFEPENHDLWAAHVINHATLTRTEPKYGKETIEVEVETPEVELSFDGDEPEYDEEDVSFGM